ncbi:hypothetical protein CNMCM5793_004609 [Aspergillus hiratsukae]|uniref:Uncharacterized protein n=1 Tax=Aspergillus hiratsukae TaxID=1194566 RepID=A0A8H6PFK7_9EURO|nr:hypothetical protein CNMCM5793_004609 [Aspergillus hiratsukae]KAF7170077.1 hypothetical protein CNMCM6106_004900 [Aspergillus hiratsukae]
MASSSDKPNSVEDAIAKVQTAPPVQKRVDLFRRLIKDLTEDPVANPNIPNVLFETNWAEDDEVKAENFTRQIIQSFKATHEEGWTHLLQTCTPNQSRMLQKFIENSSMQDIAHLFDFGSTRATREGFQDMERAKQVRLPLSHDVDDGREPWEQRVKSKLKRLFHFRDDIARDRVDIGLFDDPQCSTSVLTYENAAFSNWGRTVENKPNYTCVPTTNYGVQQIVQYAAKKGLGVRVSGYRMYSPWPFLGTGWCFGLIGVVTHITLVVDQMTYAAMTPEKVAVIDAIPPPASLRSRVPQPIYQPRTPDEIRRAQEAFEKRAAEDYYAEWFWFPYSDEMWINTWSTTTESVDVQEYPDNVEIATQWLQAIAMEALQYLAKDTKTEEILPMLRTTAVSRLAMSALPAGTEIKTWVPDALHFRRAIQNTRVRDLELEIPLPHRPDDANKPDFSIVQHACNVLMAPQRGNRLGTCSIEVLTLQSVTQYWEAFAQEVLDKWMELREWNGQKLNIRPHWAKEWWVVLSLSTRYTTALFNGTMQATIQSRWQALSRPRAMAMLSADSTMSSQTLVRNKVGQGKI